MLLLHNAKIYTMDDLRPEADAILIDSGNQHSGRILAIGERQKLTQYYGGEVQEIDMRKSCILPGLSDAHIHFKGYASSLSLLDVDTNSKAECLERVRAQAKQSSPGKWIVGHGWRQNGWAEGFGTAQELNAVAPENPVYLSAASLHAAWVNSEAMQIAGIARGSPDPENGELQRDKEGTPTGILLEKAMEMVSSKIPRMSLEDTVSAMTNAQERLWSMGLTALHDFDRIGSFKALQIMREREALKLRVLKNLPVEALDSIISSGIRSGFGDDFLRIGGIKDFADGALGPKTAAMIEPYEGEDNNRGILLADAEAVEDWGRKAVANGLSMTVHAIGDRANHEVLNGIEGVRKFEKEEAITGLRHRIEHVQIIHPQDRERLAKLGIAASVQPIHQPSDRDAADQLWGKRAKNSYAWKSLGDSGARVAFGSDSPVESPNPFWGLHAAVTRKEHWNLKRDAWQAQEKISLQEALKAYSVNPAYLAGMENKIGKLAQGMLADLIVLERDPFQIDVDEIASLSPEATMVGGNWVWKSETAA